MNLYRISQESNTGYDTYDSAVVVAETEEQARHIHPDSDCIFKEGMWRYAESGRESSYAVSVWSNPSQVQVQLIGYAAAGIDGPVICASFNAG